MNTINLIYYKNIVNNVLKVEKVENITIATVALSKMKQHVIFIIINK